MAPMSRSAEVRQRVLVVDDDGEIRTALEALLTYEGFEVWTARDGREALARMEREAAAGRPADIVLCDVKMPGLDGPGVLDALAQWPSAPAVVMISGHADVATAVDAVKRGARDFIEKPLDHNRVLVSIQAALRAERLASENSGLRRQLEERWQLVGDGPALATLREQIARAALSEAPVLVTGENGTGKELVARQIHLLSPRAAGPLVTVNCAAIPAELIESELFGHEKGSFTGAHERRTGHFEAAHGGTLFLDEVGDMPLAAQAKVLRALETFEITRVGSSTSRAVDIRVVAATNSDLAQAANDKTFRLDLFYRLNVIPLRVPPLRERRGDVPALAEHFLRRIAERSGRAAPPLEPDALALLASLDFPGNVRQLRNLLEGACALADGPTIARADIERILENGPALAGVEGPVLAAGQDPFSAATFEEFKDKSEARFFARKLAERNGNVKRTAEELGMQRSHLYKKLERYGLR
jgi:two-component system, NtrC family, nitrogen regulation response regulator NtrX